MKVLSIFLIAANLLYYEVAAVTDSDIDFLSGLNYQSVSCNCHLIYQPVCGSDGKTYSNECVLRCVSEHNVRCGRPPIHVSKQGECPEESCACPAVVDPVCGSDGHTYGNECHLVCENKRRKRLNLPAIWVVHKGTCSSAPCICSTVIIPVCGTNGRTYRNICFLQCDSRANIAKGLPPIFVKNPGPCAKEVCLCTLELNPICASDGKTYDNPCLLRCENRRRYALGLYPLVIRKPGPCTVCRCPSTIDPVCASDDRTYRNPCFLKCENDVRKDAGLPLLTVVNKGVCGCRCDKRYDPVCGSDGRTYSNICLLRCESRRRVQQGLSPVFLEHTGPCACNCRNCNIVFQPVCGSDGKTYWNLCWLRCHSDCNVREGRPKITLVKQGYC